jgi:SAM-dependent methyltransferase
MVMIIREFDRYAHEYDEALKKGIRLSGQNRAFFARGRIAWLSNGLRKHGTASLSVMDFGCGTGLSTPYFIDLLSARSVMGVDISMKSLEVARAKYAASNAQFILMDEYQPAGEFDLAFCNGVFHHISLDKRAEAISYIYRALCQKGIFALWENNPWNPGTRYIMAKIPFDKDASPVSHLEARRLLQAGGFEILSTTFLFIFPHILSWFRIFEPFLARLPLGAQYQVLCRKP